MLSVAIPETRKVPETRRNDANDTDVGSTTQAGKVTHDSRGNAVWDWAIDTDVTTSSGLLRALTPGQLALESDLNAVIDWAGDPYNRS